MNELMWSSRIILVRAFDETEDILTAFKKFDYEIRDRDIYWFVFIDDRLETNYKSQIQDNFYRDTLKNYFSDTNTNVILIGKDGGIKNKSKTLDLKEIFNLIDTMPMRQMEMRE